MKLLIIMSLVALFMLVCYKVGKWAYKDLNMDHDDDYEPLEEQLW